MQPDKDDVIVRHVQQQDGKSSVVLVGTVSVPDQFVVKTRDDAESQALRFAKRSGVQAWLVDGGDAFVLLCNFRTPAE